MLQRLGARDDVLRDSQFNRLSLIKFLRGGLVPGHRGLGHAEAHSLRFDVRAEERILQVTAAVDQEVVLYPLHFLDAGPGDRCVEGRPFRRRAGAGEPRPGGRAGGPAEINAWSTPAEKNFCVKALRKSARCCETWSFASESKFSSRTSMARLASEIP